MSELLSPCDELLDRLIAEVEDVKEDISHLSASYLIDRFPAAETAANLPQEKRCSFVVAAIDRAVARSRELSPEHLETLFLDGKEDGVLWALIEVASHVAATNSKFNETELGRVSQQLALMSEYTIDLTAMVETITQQLEIMGEKIAFDVTTKEAANAFAKSLKKSTWCFDIDILKRWIKRLEDAADITLDTSLSRNAPTDVTGVERELLSHATAAKTSKPSKKWLKTALTLVDVNRDHFMTRLPEWLASFEEQLSDLSLYEYQEFDQDYYRGLLWIASLFGDADIASAVGRVAEEAYQEWPAMTSGMSKTGNAAVWTLGQMPCDAALTELCYLKRRVKRLTAQKLIAKALAEKAAQLGVTTDEVEEIGVSACGLTGVGTREEQIGDHTARVTVNTKGKSVVVWVKPGGTEQKAVPASIKSEHAEAIKDLKSDGREIAKLMPLVRERLDRTFLRFKPWSIETWRERYIEHPVVGVLARLLIWNIQHRDDVTPVVWHDGQLIDVNRQPVSAATHTTVSLWHPLDSPTDDVLAWRALLEDLEIIQPFKQAYREVYVLTDAERSTDVYSNRFAAHILKQHQFNALASVRGWKSKTRLMFDADYPAPSKQLPEHGLRAEFWVESVGDADTDDYVLDSGSYRYVATDQVRFYQDGAAENYSHASGGRHDAGGSEEPVNQPLPLERIDRKVFSEILRDVDLFVGVASVGNDPDWVNGGLEGHFRDYWSDYSFGDLSVSAETRKAVLQRIIPRLKIAKRCSFSDRFLVVRGDVRTYRIHLGSGNIQMEPNNKYLCIVPDASINRKGNAVTLPFEGDRTLSTVLSKALLLANDKRITDQTILSQIHR